VDKFSTFAPEELEVFSVFRTHGIPYREGTKRELWARALFSEYEEEIACFEENPYYLTSIDEGSNQRVEILNRNRPDLTPMSYPLDFVDRHVGEKWENTPERARAYFHKAIERIAEDGHTVASPAQVADGMSRLGIEHITAVTDSGETENIRVGPEAVKKLETSADEVTRIRFSGPEGSRQVGITTQEFRNRAQVVSEQFKWLSRSELSYSEIAKQKLISRALSAPDFDLDETQKTAIRYAFDSAVSIITGPAGSGKTTCMQAVLSSASALLEERTETLATGRPKERQHSARCIYVLAPTGKAAQRVRDGLEVRDPETGEVITPGPTDQSVMPEGRYIEEGHLQVGTLHSFLGWRGNYCIVPDPHPSFIVVDESSMCDLDIMYWFSRYIQYCLENQVPLTVIMTGDIEQLEPVGAGHPYRDLLGRGGDSTVANTRLDHIHRQGQGSAIIKASQNILDGEAPPVAQQVLASDSLANDFYWHSYPPGGEVDVLQYLEAVAQRANQYANAGVQAEDVQLILPLRNQSSVDAEALHVNQVNKELQQIFARRRGEEIHSLTAHPPTRPDYTYGAKFARKDRVAHVGANRYVAASGDHEPVMRGSIGQIQQCDPDGGILVRYPWMDELVPYQEPQEIDGLELAYALTGHTAQGSEFSVTAVALPRAGAPTLMTRPWLYTALTRGQDFVDLMATTDRVQMCAQTDAVERRQTILSRSSY
jgi:ATP-dependent exoDNAse (exonuclease V) alpha subunit